MLRQHNVQLAATLRVTLMLCRLKTKICLLVRISKSSKCRLSAQSWLMHKLPRPALSQGPPCCICQHLKCAQDSIAPVTCTCVSIFVSFAFKLLTVLQKFGLKVAFADDCTCAARLEGDLFRLQTALDKASSTSKVSAAQDL